jgi:hypothetical protein
MECKIKRRAALVRSGLQIPAFFAETSGDRRALPRFSPGVESAAQCRNIGEAFPSVLFRPPGGRRFLRSGAVKNDLAIFVQLRFLSFELGKRSRFGQPVPLTLFRVVVGAHQKRFAGAHVAARLFGIDSFGRHIGFSSINCVEMQRFLAAWIVISRLLAS